MSRQRLPRPLTAMIGLQKGNWIGSYSPFPVQSPTCRKPPEQSQVSQTSSGKSCTQSFLLREVSELAPCRQSLGHYKPCNFSQLPNMYRIEGVLLLMVRKGLMFQAEGSSGQEEEYQDML